MVDLTEINASYLLHIGKIKEGVGEARKLEVIQDPSLIKQLCDLADPTVKKKRGRPSKQHDEDHKNEQFKVFAFFRFRRAWYEYQGAKDPATLAKGDAIEHFNLGISWFEQAHKLYWQEQFSRARGLIQEYRQNVAYEPFIHRDSRLYAQVACSVIIVSYNAGNKLLDCMHSLSRQSDQNFEIILVDNGKNQEAWPGLENISLLHVVPPINLLPSEGRNVGAFFSRGKYLVFLDDDALIHSEYIAKLQQIMERFDFVALRGRILPLGEIEGSKPPWHYDLGKSPLPAVLLTEGNMVVDKSVFDAVGGFDPLLFGREGTELTHRLLAQYPQKAIYYWPGLVIYHDFATQEKLTAKRTRQALALAYLKHLYPGPALSDVYRNWYKNMPSLPSDPACATPPRRSKKKPFIADEQTNSFLSGISCIFDFTSQDVNQADVLDTFWKTNTYQPIEMLLIGSFSKGLLQKITDLLAHKLFVRCISQSSQLPDHQRKTRAAAKAKRHYLLFGEQYFAYHIDFLAFVDQLLSDEGIGGVCIISEGFLPGEKTVAEGSRNVTAFACRKADFDDIKEEKHDKVIVVSTQVVEAGVDDIGHTPAAVERNDLSVPVDH